MNTILLVLGTGGALFALERLAPGRALPQVAGWWGRAAALNLVQAGAVWLAGVTWDRWFPALRLWDVEHLGLGAQVALGYLVITFVYYWWHRARHEVPLLWRGLHQVHHSPARLEVLTSFYKHPAEILINSVLSAALLFLAVGVSPTAAALTVALTGVAELIYHANLRTPYWLGFIFQRPESHRVHHRRGVHRMNYSDLPLWDMLFGTFENPRAADFECGFEAPRERRLGAMLLGRDVYAAPAAGRAAGGLGQAAVLAVLVAVGCVQMLGDVLDLRGLKAVGAALGASPAPKVFTAHRGFETYSSQFFITWHDAAGRAQRLELTPAVYRALRGPYNRRNAYGAALSYGPVLAGDPATRPMFESALRHALCRPEGALAELGIAPNRALPVGVELRPRDPASADPRWQLAFDVRCQGEQR